MGKACSLALLALALCAGPAPSARGQEPSGSPAQAPVPPAPDDAELRSAFQRLTPEARREVLERTEAELAFVDSFQRTLLEHVLRSQPRPPSDWPLLEDPPTYDPRVHAPAQPIPRRPLAADSPRAKDLRARIFARVPARALDSAWVYDPGARELRRVEVADELGRRFENLLRGFPPELDLAEALVEMALDDGAQQKALRAFGHAYADRAGTVAPGVTLYDAWCSGIQMEMPDVECLGIVHDVLGDWSTWRAPIPAARHRELYARLGELFVTAHRHRGLRQALARTYLVAEPVLRDGYSPHLERFHAVWDRFASDPLRLREELPAPDDWRAWLEGWVERAKEDPALLERGRVRSATLAADQRRVREVLVLVMRLSAAL